MDMGYGEGDGGFQGGVEVVSRVVGVGDGVGVMAGEEVDGDIGDAWHHCVGCCCN